MAASEMTRFLHETGEYVNVEADGEDDPLRLPRTFDRESSPSQLSGEPAYGAGTEHNSAFEQKFRDLVLTSGPYGTPEGPQHH